MHRIDTSGDQRKKLDTCTPPQTPDQIPRAQTVYMCIYYISYLCVRCIHFTCVLDRRDAGWVTVTTPTHASVCVHYGRRQFFYMGGANFFIRSDESKSGTQTTKARNLNLRARCLVSIIIIIIIMYRYIYKYKSLPDIREIRCTQLIYQGVRIQILNKTKF
jgi:hypothetical protein